MRNNGSQHCCPPPSGRRCVSLWLLLPLAIPAGACVSSSKSAPTRGLDSGAAEGADVGTDEGSDGSDGEDSPSCEGELSLDGVRALTSSGVVEGMELDEGLAFLGIPFAEAPTGPRRFSLPEPKACVPGQLVAADALPPPCPQRSDETGLMIGEEDCLYLNVWTPAVDDATRPVLVFVHGGGNVQGSSSEGSDYGLYDGARLSASHDVVVVTLQYRLGALGFLAHPALSEEGGGSSGNYGLWDQRLALQWVRDNIAAMGGDPDRVLLFGESAGAQDTCMQVVSPQSAGLFSAALNQSGTCTSRRLRDAEEEGLEHVSGTSCAAGMEDAELVDCLRALPVEELVGMAGDVISELGIPGAAGFGPVYGDAFVPDPPLETIAAGAHTPVPWVLGSNTDETSQWAPAMDAATYTATVEALFGRASDEVLEVYPADGSGSPREAWIQLTTDAVFTCPARWVARAATDSQEEPVWRYLFGKVPTGTSGALYGAWHGLELVYVFQAIDGVSATSGYRPDDQDLVVETFMGAAWSALARDGAPAAAHDWPEAGPDGGLLFIGDTIEPRSDGRAEKCELWERLGLVGG